MTTSRSERSTTPSNTSRCEVVGAVSTVCSVVTMGGRSERMSSSTWPPAMPPKMPNSCCSETTCAPLSLMNSAARP